MIYTNITRRMLAYALMTAVAVRSARGKTKQLILAHADVAGSILDITANEFARRLNLNLAGRYEIIVKGSKSLGEEEAILNLVKEGKVAFCLSFPALAMEIPLLTTFNLPYLVLTRKHIRETRTKLLETYLKPPARRGGFELMAMWDNGFSHVTTNLPLELAGGEAKGIRVRVPPGSVDAKFISRLGLVPEEIPDERVYDALKSNEVTAQASSLATIVSGRYFEVQKYLVLSGHAYRPSFLIASVAYFFQLNGETRRAITSVARSLEDWSIEIGAGQEAKMIDQFMAKIDNLIEPGLEQIALPRLAPRLRLHAPLPKCTRKENQASRSWQRRPPTFASFSAIAGRYLANPNCQNRYKASPVQSLSVTSRTTL